MTGRVCSRCGKTVLLDENGDLLPHPDMEKGMGAVCGEPISGRTLTSEVTVTCSYCEAVITVPFRHGAVMPDPEGSGVHTFMPRLDGGDHVCQSDRAKREREWHRKTTPARTPSTQKD